eukprot:6197816-Pleurochrysis_carterae.AAC.1
MLSLTASRFWTSSKHRSTGLNGWCELAPTRLSDTRYLQAFLCCSKHTSANLLAHDQLLTCTLPVIPGWPETRLFRLLLVEQIVTHNRIKPGLVALAARFKTTSEFWLLETGCTPTRDHANRTQVRTQPNGHAEVQVVATVTGQAIFTCLESVPRRAATSCLQLCPGRLPDTWANRLARVLFCYQAFPSIKHQGYDVLILDVAAKFVEQFAA